MEGTNINYPDTDNSHDHTYEGNGCSNGGPGSKNSCSTNMTKTYDSEDQSIGSYYNFQAATSGSGAAITTDNTNTPDTFCPLGWQLPYDGTGGDYYDKSKSWIYMFVAYGIDITAQQTSQQQKMRSYPTSIIYTGNYRWDQGTLHYFGIHSLLQTPTASGSSNYGAYLYNQTVNISVNNKSYGAPIRCALGIGILEKLSMASAFTH